MPQKHTSLVWSKFPDLFFRIIERIKMGETSIFIPMERKQDAWMARSKWYRFCEAVRRAESDADEARTPRLDRVACGLDDAIKVTYALAVSATRTPPWGLSLRIPCFMEMPKFVSVGQAQKDQIVLRKMSLGMQEIAALDDEAAFKRISQPTANHAAGKPEQQQISTVVCPATELPCIKGCSSICVLTKEALHGA